MRLVLITSTVLFVMLACNVANGYRADGSQVKESIIADRSEFRYVIYSNELLHDSRIISVLLERKAFSEKTLKKLFGLIAIRFPQPEELHVTVVTDLDQIPTPEEKDQISFLSYSEVTSILNPIMQKYPTAVYLRQHGNESFHYITGLPDRMEKVVIIKGSNLLRTKQ